MSFKYINCLNRPYRAARYVRSVEFDIGRYGEYTSSITFGVLVTEKYAVKSVERYLSTPLSKDYFDKLEGDLVEENWEVAKHLYRVKGDCLGDAIYLERVEAGDAPNSIVLRCGS